MSDKSTKLFRSVIISFLLIFYFSNGFAQDEQEGSGFFDRCFFGGGFGAQFGDQTIVSATPILGYKVTEKFHVGIGGTYIYYNLKQYYPDPNGSGNLLYYKYTSNVYGGSVFTKYYLFDQVFAYAEYGILNMDVFNEISYTSSRQNINSALIGGGYRQMIGSNAGIELTVLYDVIDDRNSPYSNPIIRLGFVAGF